MAYQIKSTPFFQRIVKASKKNGQLQRLKDEYERIKEFDTRTLELRMRKVRLKRLFREIEEIKDASSKRRYFSHEMRKTREDMRLEMLLRSKELGKEFSKANVMNFDRCISRHSAPSSHISNTATRLEADKKALAEKRIRYGNETSRHNLQKLAKCSKKRPVKRGHKAISTVELDKKEKLKLRLMYGNSCLDIFMSKIAKQDLRQDVTAGHTQWMLSSDILQEDGLDGHAIDYLSIENVRSFNSLVKLPSGPTRTTTRALYVDDDGEVVETRPKLSAKENWQRLAFLVRNAFSKAVTEQQQSVGYQLRNIPNNTHLPRSKLARTPMTQFGSEDESTGGEEFISVETLNSVISAFPKAEVSHPDPLPNLEVEATDTEIDLRKKAITQNDVEKYVKGSMEPFTLDGTTSKEATALSVQKLRNIFEHNV